MTDNVMSLTTISSATLFANGSLYNSNNRTLPAPSVSELLFYFYFYQVNTSYQQAGCNILSTRCNISSIHTRHQQLLHFTYIHIHSNISLQSSAHTRDKLAKPQSVHNSLFIHSFMMISSTLDSFIFLVFFL